MPRMPVPEGRRGVAASGVRSSAGVKVLGAPGPDQRQMQGAVGGEGTHDHHWQGEPAAGEWPDEGELGQRERDHQAPGHRSFGDRVMAERGEHTADEGEQPGPGTGSRPARTRARLPAAVPRPVLTRHGRPSSPLRPLPVSRYRGWRRPAGPGCGWRGTDRNRRR
jgi:hypothetical protein